MVTYWAVVIRGLTVGVPLIGGYTDGKLEVWVLHDK